MVIATIPLTVPVALYFICDPFKVLRTYDDYFADGLSVNKGVVTASTFEAENPAHHYDSFILGSSISCYYEADNWKKFLEPGARPFHFDTSNQPIRTLRRTVEYLERNAYSLRNILIVLDPFIFRLQPDKTDMVFIDPPQIRKEWWYKTFFHYKMISHFLNVKYLVSYLPWLYSKEKRSYCDTNIFEPQPITWDRITNEEHVYSWDDSISHCPEIFYARHPIGCEPKPYNSSKENLINKDIEEDMRTIAVILNRNGCNYKVVISPNLRREVLNECDDRIMRNIFGHNYHNLGRDFHAAMTDHTNFYDNTHYRASLAGQIMQKIYAGTDIENMNRLFLND
ncbi:hypothetical protein [Xylanibacter muris]|uniref:SGNH/GDSL hydrolase family protein n=2 Tax=Xylanibacter muris TaxID=2736290 RepID=A0ABX2ASI3_9BACT|nr:hypothetical protein [Xylanibacter muris]NPD93207.1 hypothetical protein [Xylanibacter muris]